MTPSRRRSRRAESAELVDRLRRALRCGAPDLVSPGELIREVREGRAIVVSTDRFRQIVEKLERAKR